jgi:hypothetical protein
MTEPRSTWPEVPSGASFISRRVGTTLTTVRVGGQRAHVLRARAGAVGDPVQPAVASPALDQVEPGLDDMGAEASAHM